MIRPLRRRHLGTVAGLAILVPALYLAAIQARPPATLSEPFDPELAPAGLDSDAEEAFTQEWSALPIHSRLLAAGGDLWIEVAATDELPHPDVLVYWSAVEPASDSPLTDARLLGALVQFMPPNTPGFWAIVQQIVENTSAKDKDVMTQAIKASLELLNQPNPQKELETQKEKAIIEDIGARTQKTHVQTLDMVQEINVRGTDDGSSSTGNR